MDRRRFRYVYSRRVRRLKPALIDTNAWLWLVGASERLGSSARELLEDPGNELKLSVVSAWEVIIKTRLGKLEVLGDAATFLRTRLAAQRIATLDVSFEHVLAVNALPLLHRDPFDRLIIAQAIVENIPIISSDEQLSKYAIEWIDARA